MPEFKCVISDPKTGTAKTIELKGDEARPLLNLKIGDEIEGSLLGLKGKRLIITGGSDRSGFPMIKGIHGGVKRKVLLSKGVGLRKVEKGERKRVTVRGEVITEDIYQINLVIKEG